MLDISPYYLEEMVLTMGSTLLTLLIVSAKAVTRAIQDVTDGFFTRQVFILPAFFCHQGYPVISLSIALSYGGKITKNKIVISGS
jgi:hypothetical protein